MDWHCQHCIADQLLFLAVLAQTFLLLTCWHESLWTTIVPIAVGEAAMPPHPGQRIILGGSTTFHMLLLAIFSDGQHIQTFFRSLWDKAMPILSSTAAGVCGAQLDETSHGGMLKPEWMK